MKFLKIIIFLFLSLSSSNSLLPINVSILNNKGKFKKSKLTKRINQLITNSSREKINEILIRLDLYLLIDMENKNFILIEDAVYFEGIAQEIFAVNKTGIRIIQTIKKITDLKKNLQQLYKASKNQTKTNLYNFLGEH